MEKDPDGVPTDLESETVTDVDNVGCGVRDTVTVGGGVRVGEGVARADRVIVLSRESVADGFDEVLVIVTSCEFRVTVADAEGLSVLIADAVGSNSIDFVGSTVSDCDWSLDKLELLVGCSVKEAVSDGVIVSVGVGVGVGGGVSVGEKVSGSDADCSKEAESVASTDRVCVPLEREREAPSLLVGRSVAVGVSSLVPVHDSVGNNAALVVRLPW